MQRAELNGAELEYEVHGQGDPVLLIHGAHVADSFRPLMGHHALRECSLIAYRRRGYGGSTPAEGSPESYVSRAGHDAAALLRYLEVERAHVVGHSSGAVVALQFACQSPALLESLILIEPPLPSVPSASAHFAPIAAAAGRYFGGDAKGAVDDFMRHVAGLEWRKVTAGAVPGGIEQAEHDAATFFEFELPGLGAWQCDVDRAKSFPRPVLFMQGDATPKFHAEARSVVHDWLPQTEDHVVRGAGHMVMIDNPRGAAEGIAAFLNRVA
jgi:pimeloyl-ACP methyl ester carboxylesterase